MKWMSRKARLALAASGLVLLSVIGATAAYYTSSKQFSNYFSVGAPGAAVQEKFNPADRWAPGEDKEKVVIFRNTGDMDMLLRFTVEAGWKDPAPADAEFPPYVLYWNTDEGDGAEEDPAQAGAFRTTDDGRIKDFQKVTVNVDGENKDYYYYKKILKAGESTEKVLKSVKFKTELTNAVSGSQINLTVKGETVLVNRDAALEAWGITPDIKDNGEVIWPESSGTGDE